MTRTDLDLAIEAWQRIVERAQAGEPLVRLTRQEVLALDAAWGEMGEEILELRQRIGDAPGQAKGPQLHLVKP